MPQPSRPAPAARAAPGTRCGAGLALVALLCVGGGPVEADPEPFVIGVLGTAADGLLADAEAGARLALALPGLPAADDQRIEIQAADDRGTAEGLKAALSRWKQGRLAGVVALPTGDMHAVHAEAARTSRVPWFALTPWPVDAARGAGNVWHLAPTISEQGTAMGDALRAPLGASSVAIVHEPTALGRLLAAAIERNLPWGIHRLGVHALETGAEERAVAALLSRKPACVCVAALGAHLARFTRALEAAPEPLACLYPDLARSETLRAAAPRAFEGSLVLGGPDTELVGRAGEALLNAQEKAGLALSETLVRAAEAARRLTLAVRTAEGTTAKKIAAALLPHTPTQGLLGALAFEPPGTVRFFPVHLWRGRKGKLEEYPAGLLPAPGCGPPLGFARQPEQPRSAQGRLGVLTWGEAPVRTIEQDLKELQLISGGYDPELDELVRDEILARAIRIAYRLFRREADGSPIVGWSWGMTFTTKAPAERSPSEVWTATVAGDDPEAGGRVTGSGTVAVYSTFLKRTMYVQHKLEPPLTVADKPFLMARYRWGEDKYLDRRAEELRCLMDGFASAIGMTLAHEFGHLCGCGHDTEHPTSIMNVVAGAGAAWADAVWIPSHQRNLTLTLGIEGVEK
jgi:ABC-type branched-subunit amino acid transport system substrate-binding protein